MFSFEELKDVMKSYDVASEKLEYLEEYNQQDIFIDYINDNYSDIDIESLANSIENDYGISTWFYEHKPCELLDIEDLENTKVMELAIEEGLEYKLLAYIKEMYPYLNREELIEELEYADYEQVKENL